MNQVHFIVNLTLEALIDVFRAVWAFVALSTRASERPVDRASLAYGIRMAGIRGASIVQMAQ